MKTAKWLFYISLALPALAFAASYSSSNEPGVPWFIWWLVTLVGFGLIFVATRHFYKQSSTSFDQKSAALDQNNSTVENTIQKKQPPLMRATKAVDIRVMVDVVLALANHIVGDKNLKLVNAVPHGLPTVQADEQKLQQIFYYLVVGALKTTQNGHITVSAMVIAEQIRVAVTDSGEGFSAQQIEQIFEPVQRQTLANGGLPLAKHWVELHGGEIELRSEVGVGSTFSFALPIVGKPELEVGLTLGSANFDIDDLERQQLATIHEHQFRLLLVDDDETARQALAEHLSLAGYQLVEAQNGQQAMDALKQQGPFDLILLDIMMPGISGFEVCREIRQTHLKSDLAIVLLTTNNQALELVHCFAVGGNDYISKPVGEFELLARVKSQLTLLETFRLEKNQQKSEVEPSQNTISPPDLTGFEILLVDDNVIDTQLTGELLADTGATVTTLVDGLAAVSIVANVAFDLVLMDIEMPIMGGVEATKTIRYTLNEDELPIIALTTHEMMDRLEQFKAVGMNEHIAKPIEPQMLYQVLNHYLIESSSDSQLLPDEPLVAIATLNPKSFMGKLATVVGLDTATALAKMNGKTALYRNLVKAFISARHCGAQVLLELFEQQAWDDLYRNVHSLKSNSAYIGAFDVSALSKSMINACDEGHYERELLTPLCAALNALMIQLNNIMAEFKDELVATVDVGPQIGGTRYTVLIIEDSSQMRMFLTGILSQDYTVYSAADGEEGILQAKEKMPDLIVSDLVMPGKSGYEVCSALKSDDTTCHIPIILLTAKSDLESRKQGWREQADEYLTKPCDEDELKLRLANLLGIREALKQRFGQVLRHTFEVLPTVAKEYSERDQQFLQRFTSLLGSRCGDSELKISDVATELAVTVRTLQNKLKSLTDNSFTEYLAMIRMVKAKDLLKQGKKVADVAWETGFTEHTYFSKFFKEHAGETPTQFKQRL
jgi:CheY-like chemotaxis protein